jgi:hypothetical protein
MAVRRIVEKKSAVRFIGLFLHRSKELIVGLALAAGPAICMEESQDYRDWY